MNNLLKDMKLLNEDHTPEGFPAVKMSEINGLIEIIEKQSIQLAKANERVEMLLPITDTLYGLARNQLWIAYVWNDHNFKETPEMYAKEAAESLSILSVEEANKLFDAYQQLRKEQFND